MIRILSSCRLAISWDRPFNHLLARRWIRSTIAICSSNCLVYRNPSCSKVVEVVAPAFLESPRWLIPTGLPNPLLAPPTPMLPPTILPPAPAAATAAAAALRRLTGVWWWSRLSSVSLSSSPSSSLSRGTAEGVGREGERRGREDHSEDPPGKLNRKGEGEPGQVTPRGRRWEGGEEPDGRQARLRPWWCRVVGFV